MLLVINVDLVPDSHRTLKTQKDAQHGYHRNDSG